MNTKFFGGVSGCLIHLKLNTETNSQREAGLSKQMREKGVKCVSFIIHYVSIYIINKGIFAFVIGQDHLPKNDSDRNLSILWRFIFHGVDHPCDLYRSLRKKYVDSAMSPSIPADRRNNKILFVSFKNDTGAFLIKRTKTF